MASTLKLDKPLRGRIYDSIAETIGNTPLVRIPNITKEDGLKADVLLKLEFFNPLASVKDRIGVNMIEVMEAEGKIGPGAVIIEPTSGNTGIGLAFVCAARGYRLVLTMPESVSIERRKMLQYLGAEIDLTPREKGMNGAVARAKELLAQHPGSVTADQFGTASNPDIHRRTTAEEIAADFPDGLDAMITGVGTGGHLTGCAQVLKAKWPNLKVYAVEPAASPVISGGAPSPHPIQGIGAGFIPVNLKTELLDGVIQVEAEAAREMARRSAREEGMLVGISSGATLAAIAQKLPDLGASARVLGFNYDTGERYLSIEGFLPA